jgi:tetratricopeptide (TPR) repeat protein
MRRSMKRINRFRHLSWHAFAAVPAVALLLPAIPALADSISYHNAFEHRVSDTGDRASLDNFVVEAARRGQYDQALSTLEEIIFRTPNDLGARLALARIYYQIADYDTAAAHLEQALLTPGWEDFAKEIEELKARVERGQRGLEIRMAVTAGGAYENTTQNVGLSGPNDSEELTSPYGEIEGVIIRDLQTATRDEIRFGGALFYGRSLGDPDFLGSLSAIDAHTGHFDVTYSKGLPDIIDTLRLDVTGYGRFQTYGGGRDLQEYGAETVVSVQPTVESQIKAHLGYGWLGNSHGLYSDRRMRAALTGDLRIAPGVAVGAHVSGYYDWGTTPLAFTDGSFDFNAHGVEVGASVSHLLHVFADGRSWVHEAGVRYSRERILDYASVTSLGSPNADLADREAWEIFWNHTVQIATHVELGFGVSYGEEKLTDTVFPSVDRSGETWGAKAGLTYRFN